MWREGTSTADLADAVTNVSHVTLPSEGAARVTIPDTELLFTAKYSQAGSDLVLTGADGHKLIVTGYFDHEKHADLVAPGGASLSADLVAKLTISQTPGQYAQAGAPAGATVIGKVERLGGAATVQHANGTVEELHIGDAIYQGDVIETSGGSQVGLSLNDGSAFNMGANARMVLNELVYDSASNSNSGIFSLVKGSITFVAGQVAKTGDMRVETPVATMGIRGTTVNTSITADIGGNVVSVTYSLMTDPDGHVGSFNLIDKNSGAIIGTISTTDTSFVIRPTANLSVLATQTDKTPEQVQQEMAIASVLFPIFLSNPANFLTNPNPNVNPNDLQPKKGAVGSGSYLDYQGHSTGLGGVPELNVQTTLINETIAVTVIRDGNPVPETVTQTIQVPLPNNFAPLISGDTPPHLKEAPSNFENGSTSVAQLTKSDIDGTASYDVAALLAAGWTDNHNGTFSKDGQYGTATLNTNTNTLTYQLDQTKADPLNVDDHPVEDFTIPVVDNQGATNSTVVSFTIDGANDAPTITASVNRDLVEASGHSLGVWTATATLTKGDVDGTASYDAAALSAGGWFSLGFGIYTKLGHYGLATLNTNTGKVTYLLDNIRANSLADGETVHDNFTVPVKDDRGATGSTTVSFTIDGTNDAPVIFGKTTGAVEEDGGPCEQIATGQLTAVDFDHGATATWSTVGSTTGTYGSIAIDSSGKWTYTLNNSSAAVQALAQGETRFDTFTIKVTDDKGGTDTQVVKIKVTGTNDAPTIKSVVDHDLVEASGANPGIWTATATLTKGDIDGTASYDTAALSHDGWVTLGFGIYFKLGNYGLATLDINSGKVTYVLDNIRANALNVGDHPTDDFTIPVKDNLGATNSTVVSFTIDGTNDAPVILVSLPQPLLLIEDSVTASVAHLVKSDVDGTASYDAAALTSHGWTDNNDGTFTKDGQYGTATLNTATNAVTYALDPAKANPLAFGQTVTESFYVGVVDNNGATSSASASFIVTGTNDAPVVDLDTSTAGSTATLEYIESDPLTAIAPHAAVTDVDSANFRGGSLTVSFTANGTASDQLKILTDGVVTVTGANHVKVNGVDIGTISGGSNGVNGAPLKITFTSNAATPDVVSTLMQHIGFENTSSDPSSLTRTVTFKVVDGDGVTFNGHDTGQMTATVSVQPVTYFVGGPHSNFATIQAAINAAHDGDTILVAAGTYNESLNINKGVKILGANAGIDGDGTRGAETVITGQALVTAGATLDGLRIENHTDNNTQFIGIRVQTSQDVTIENTVFYSYGPNGNTNDRAIYLDTTAQGHVTIADNLISGDTPAKYGSAGWHQAIWSDGSASQLDITGNTIKYARTAIDLESYNDAHTNVSGNTFVADGTGLSIGTPTGATITGIHDNAFNGVDLDFNLSNITTAQSLDLGSTHNVAGTTADDATGVMKVFGTIGGDTITGTSGADFLDARDHEDGRPDTASNVLDGRGGDDVLLGYNGNDRLIGGAGNDKIDGGAGTDTAAYATLPNVSGISFDSGTGTWTVDATASGEGTDQLSNVEQISDGTHHILLVSNSASGGYTSIQAAITAAQDGDTILIAAGTYNENLTIAGKHLTMTGAGDSGPNATTLTGQINASGTLTGALIIENIAINATGHQYGVFLSSDGAAGSILLDNTTIWGAQSNGFAYVRAGNGSTPTLTDTVSAISILNSEFFNNATVNSGGNGRGDILLFGYNGNLTVDNVNIHDPGAAAQKAIQLRGLQTTGVDVADHGPYQAAGDVLLANLTIHGNYAQDLIAVYNIANFQSFNTSGMDIDASAPWGIINLDGVGGAIDLSSFNATNLSAGGLVAHEQGLDSAETFTGTSGNDILDGRLGPDVLNGGGGDDTIVGFTTGDVVNGGANNDTIVLTGTGANALGSALDTDIVQVEAVSAAAATAGVTIDLHSQSEGFTITGSANNDTITGSKGADTIQGGAGVDTAVYAGLPNVSGISFDSGTGTWTVDATATGQGVDKLSNVEQISDGTHHILLVSNSATGGYTTIQAAINAAQNGDTILIAAGTYDEDLIINKALTILGAHAGEDGTAGTRDATVGAGETNIIGHSKVTAAGAVVLDGLRFVNDGTTTGGGASNPTLQITTGANHVVTNSVFYSQVHGAGADDRAISLPVIAGGDVTISDNLITGIAPTNLFGGNTWGRGIWFDGGGVDLHVTGNTIDYARSAINVDMSGDSAVNIDGNTFHSDGSAFSVGIDQDGLTFSGNTFQNVGDEFNFRNLSDVTFDAGTTNSSVVPAVPANPGNDLLSVLGGDGNDHLTGSAAADLLVGNDKSGSHADDDTLDGRGGNDVLAGGGGNDSLTGGAGNDQIDGGSGVDTAVYTGSITAANVTDAGGHWTVDATAGAEGTDQLVNVERIESTGGHILLVGNGGYASIQAAITAAQNGDTIMIADGTYAEHLTIDKQLTLVGSSNVIVQGTFLTDNHISGSVADFLKTATSYTGAAGNGITVAADNVTIRGITVNGFNSAINLGDGIHNTLIKDVTISGSVNGIYKGTTADVTGLTVNGGTITDDYIGIYFAKVAAHGDGLASQIVINGTTFDHLTQKGIYAEALDHATITGITMNDVGQYGGGPAFGANGTNGAGIDINLKYDSYSNIDISDFHFTNVGASNGLGSSHFNAGAITVKTRDDGAYQSMPASFTGAVTIENGTIDGTSTGIRAGEAHKNIAGPAVTVDDVVITNAVHNADHGDFANVTQSVMTVIGTDGNDVFFASPTTTGPLDITGGDGNDIYYVGHTATIHELPGGGIDEVRSTESIVLADNVEKATLLDGASNTQTFTDMAVGAITNGENGWKFAGPTVDQAVIDLGGNHMFHISSDPSNGTFGGPYSPGLSVAAGEAAAGAAYQHQSISFDFGAVNPLGDDSRIEVDFANAAGTDRNNFMVIESVAGQGVRIAVSEPDVSGDFSGTGDPFPTDWRELVSNVDATVQHHLELRLDYVDGPNNDLISVYLDGVQIGTTTTFENYHDADPDNLYSYVDHTAAAKDYMTDRILFRVGNNGQPEDGPAGQNQGFNFDNVTSAVYNNTNVTGNTLDNVITGNSGNNTLTGGAGADTFVFTSSFGHDIVTDFTVGTDKINIDHTVVADFNALMGLTDDASGSSIITVDAAHSITLTSVLKNTLSASDFHFV